MPVINPRQYAAPTLCVRTTLRSSIHESASRHSLSRALPSIAALLPPPHRGPLSPGTPDPPRRYRIASSWITASLSPPPSPDYSVIVRHSAHQRLRISGSCPAHRHTPRHIQKTPVT